MLFAKLPAADCSPQKPSAIRIKYSKPAIDLKLIENTSSQGIVDILDPGEVLRTVYRKLCNPSRVSFRVSRSSRFHSGLTENLRNELAVIESGKFEQFFRPWDDHCLRREASKAPENRAGIRGQGIWGVTAERMQRIGSLDWTRTVPFVFPLYLSTFSFVLCIRTPRYLFEALWYIIAVIW